MYIKEEKALISAFCHANNIFGNPKGGGGGDIDLEEEMRIMNIMKHIKVNPYKKTLKLNKG